MVKSIFEMLKDYLGGNEIHNTPEIPPKKATPSPEETEKMIPLQIILAKKYRNLEEVKDNVKLKALLGFDPAKTAWCAGFVNAIEKMAGRKGSGQLAARGYLNYGTSVSNPKMGDIVVFKRGSSSWQGHVGYFINKTNEGILVLGGNQSDKVCYKYYPESALLGYRRP